MIHTCGALRPDCLRRLAAADRRLSGDGGISRTEPRDGRGPQINARPAPPRSPLPVLRRMVRRYSANHRRMLYPLRSGGHPRTCGEAGGGAKKHPLRATLHPLRSGADRRKVRRERHAQRRDRRRAEPLAEYDKKTPQIHIQKAGNRRPPGYTSPVNQRKSAFISTICVITSGSSILTV